MNKEIKAFNRFFPLHKVLFLLIFTLFFAPLGYTFIQRIGAFGCSDQCANFVAAYFMLKGKQLYSQVFFNHQLLMPYISFILQYVFHPVSIYKLVLHHHIFMVLLAFIINSILIVRFGIVGFCFAIFYEATKYYLHGNLFLPEAIAVYPLIYMFLLAIKTFKGDKIKRTDALIAALTTWFVIFLREPYIPLSLLLFSRIVIYCSKKNKILSICILIVLSVVSFFSVDFSNYIFDVFTVNSQSIQQRISLENIAKSFFYPVLILIDGKRTFLGELLVLLNVVFLIFSFIFLTVFKEKKLMSFIFIVLGFSAIRFVQPGTMYFEAFHILPWYALFLASIFYMFERILEFLKKKRLFCSVVVYFVLIFLYIVFSPRSFLQDSIDKQREFTTNFASYFAYGQTIKTLAEKESTVYLDVWDDLIYWETGLDSPFQYSLFIPVMKIIPKFENARLEMFKKTPPDFYYSRCTEKDNYSFPPLNIQNSYLQLLKNGENSCLFIKKFILDKVTKQQIVKIAQFGFSTP